MKTKSGTDSKALLQLFSNRLVGAIDNKANKVTDTENKQVVSRGEGGGGSREIVEGA